MAVMSGNATVAAVVAKDLAGYGARRCFGLLGTANFKISHGLVESGVELISARHEGNAAAMGDGWFFKIKTAALVPANDLMDEAAYQNYVKGLHS